MNRILLLVVWTLLLTGCGISIKSDSSEKITTNDKYPQDASVQSDDFIYKLYTEKEVYEEFEEITVYAELIYVGAQESIEITHSASPFYFPIEEQTRGIVIDYAMNDPEIHTTLVKDIPFKEKYVFAGGYSDQDDQQTIEFVKTIRDKGFPIGNYVVKGLAQFNQNETKYDLNVNVGFQVK